MSQTMYMYLVASKWMLTSRKGFHLNNTNTILYFLSVWRKFNKLKFCVTKIYQIEIVMFSFYVFFFHFWFRQYFMFTDAKRCHGQRWALHLQSRSVRIVPEDGRPGGLHFHLFRVVFRQTHLCDSKYRRYCQHLHWSHLSQVCNSWCQVDWNPRAATTDAREAEQHTERVKQHTEWIEQHTDRVK